MALNEVGQLYQKKLHSTDRGNSFFQQVDYAYNERGWLTNSNSALFNMQLKYNDGTNAQFNGNIASQTWTTNGQSQHTYTYAYDKLNRLLSGTADNGYGERGIVYDVMGNITKLSRQYNSVVIDSLTYSYASGTTNQLQSIADATTNDQGLKHGSFNYTYDGNGNIIADGSKGLTVTYNLLNLPATNTLASSTVSYVYDAAGRKLRRISTAGEGNTTEYIDGIQYNGTAIDFIQTEEGRVLNPTSTRNYEYALSDNLGNTRVTFDTGTNTASVTQRDDYMPFGMEVSVGSIVSPKNEYLYNKKELQEELGQYDYGARFYDPVIARWTSVDPSAEDGGQESLTPYQYGINDPIKNTDPDGRCPSCIITAAFEAAGAEELVTGGAGTPAAVATVGAGLVVAGVDALWTWGSNAYHAHQAAQVMQSSSNSNKKGDTPENPQPTSRAARRDAQRKGGVPTSQPLHQDKKSNSEDQVLLDRDGDHTVQDAKNDQSHQGQPHWEAGKTKKDPNKPDGLNRSGGKTNKPQMQNGTKGKSYYPPDNQQNQQQNQKKSS